LLSAGRRVIVDGHPICDLCGGAVEPFGAEQWRHGSGRAAKPSLAQIKDLQTYREYRARLSAAGRLRNLGARDNPFLELALLLSSAPPSEQRLLDLEERRRELASLFSWAIPSEPALAVLAKYAPLVECGAGMGYWAALLRARGVDALAYDIAPPGAGVRNAYHGSSQRRGRQPWTEVRQASAVAAARRHRERTLVLCWPPYEDDEASYGALRAYHGDVAIHIGERDEGATGSVRFHRELRLNWTLAEELELPHWPRLRDRLMVYRRNAKRQPLAERDRCFECRRFIATGSIGRCDTCFALRPPALALRVGKHRVEYPQEVVDAMPPALRKAFAASRNRIRRA
jgi:hypothetical protein